MKKNLSILLWCAFVLLKINSSEAAVRYVKVAATGSGDGSSWANAGTLSQQLQSAVWGDELWVASGEYIPTLNWQWNANPSDPRTRTFAIKEGVSLYGGFAGVESALGQRNPKLNICVLNGDLGTLNNNSDNAYHVVLAVNSSSGIKLDGFTITNGNADISGQAETIASISVYMDMGSAAFIYGGSNSITNNVFINNNGVGYGTLICQGMNHNYVSNNFFISNTMRYGGGCTIVGGIATVYNNAFISNTADQLGGGLYLFNSIGSATNNTFFKNKVTNAGAGIAVVSNNTTVANNLFNSNTVNGTINYVDSDYASVLNNTTFKYNLTDVPDSYHTGTDTTNLYHSPSYFIDSADIDGPDNQYGTADDGLRIFTCSFSYNMGNNGYIASGSTTDLSGGNRIQAGTVDMGAYETTTPANSTVLIKQSPDYVSCLHESHTFRVILQGTNLNYQWQKDGNDLPGETKDSIYFANISSGDYGVYSITVHGACGSVYDTSSLTYYPSTSIDQQPYSIRSCVGGEGTFTVMVSGVMTSFQWQKDGTNITGETNATLQLSNITMADQGNYSVRVTGACDTIYSDTVQFTPITNNRKYVNPFSTNTTEDGLSWNTCFKNLDDALNNSCAGTEIWIAGDTVYIPSQDFRGNQNPANEREKTFYLYQGLKLYGGFSGNESSLSERNVTAHPTILSGNIGDSADSTDNCYHTLIALGSPTDTIVLDGLIIQDGFTNSVNSGVAYYLGRYIYQNAGAGIYGVDVLLNITNCQIRSNLAVYGGGMFLSESAFSVSSSEFNNNQGTNWGAGAMGFEYCHGKVYSSYIHHNTTTYGNVYVYDSEVTLANNIIAHNRGDFASGIINETSIQPIRVINNTIANNHVTTSNTVNNAAGLYSMNPGDTIANNLFWGNTIGGDAYVDFADVFPNQLGTFISNLFQLDSIRYAFANGLHNLYHRNPLFVDSTDFDGADNVIGTADDGIILQPTSPALNKGNNSLIPSYLVKDFMGNPRIFSTVDIGAYENQTITSIITRSGNSSNTLKAYPNPFMDIVTIEIAEGNIDHIKVRDLTGRQVIQLNPDGIQATLDLKNLPQGLYVVEIGSNGNYTTLEIQKK